jgi:predicted PurR-regulated permease PerM
MAHFSPSRLRATFYVLVSTVAALYIVQFAWAQLQFLSSIILLFFAAWLISFIFSPIAKWLRRRGLPQLLSVALVYLMLAVLLTGFIALAIPLISTQVNQIAGRITVLTTPANLASLNQQTVSFLKSIGVSDSDAHRMIDQLTANLQGTVHRTVSGIVANAADLLSSIANILLDTVIVLILSFYMMLDGRRINNNLIERLPTDWQVDARSFQTHVARVFGGFMRSQLIIGFSYGLLTWLILMGLGVPGGFLVGLVCGIIMIIPFVGPYLALLPPMALTLLQVSAGDLIRTEVILFLALFVAQQLVMQVLAPRIMSQGVGLHPLWLFAGLLLGAKIAGVWGAFFAPPVAALVAVVLDVLYQRFRQNNPLFSPNGHAVLEPDEEPLEEFATMQSAPE